MAGPYGDSVHIRQLLNLVEDVSPSTAERIDALNATVSSIVEDELGRSFGATATDTTVLFWAENSDVLVLPRPLRTITTVTYGGIVTGSTMTGGSVLTTDYWTPSIVDQDGLIYALRMLSGVWWGVGVPVTITGQWAATDADASVPDDLVYAVDYLVAEHFKIEQASPAGFTGPDGSTVPIRNPWKADIWLKVKAKYEVSNRELVL
jgi:hypothetical protein